MPLLGLSVGARRSEDPHVGVLGEDAESVRHVAGEEDDAALSSSWRSSPSQKTASPASIRNILHAHLCAVASGRSAAQHRELPIRGLAVEQDGRDDAIEPLEALVLCSLGQIEKAHGRSISLCRGLDPV